MLGSFSFVDRITKLEPGTRARGCFAIAAGLPHFSPGLVAEAVGQLAAWVAMAHADFQRRPVAALAGEVRVVAPAVPGRVLDLGVDIDAADEEIVAYGGWARMDGAPVVELARCVGVMLPMEGFDAPGAVRERCALLCGSGAARDRFRGVAPLHCDVIDRAPGTRVRALLHVPVAAPFFADHFPRRPVFPATLLLDVGMQLAADLARDIVQRGVQVRRAQHIKMRAFIQPGEDVEILVDGKASGRELATLAFTAAVNGRRVATAQVEVAAQELS